MTPPDHRLPATVLGGFLGAGKTTLLTGLLNRRDGRRIAVIVNDMAEVNIDADLIRSGDASLSATDESLVELSNGCICCTLREDLLAEVRRLAETGRFDLLLIEATGISEPIPVATTFEFCDAERVGLSDVARLDAMVTVVDAANLLADFNSTDLLADRKQERGPDDARSIVELLVDQIEFADVIVLNKISLAGPERTRAARRVIEALNPDARVIETDFGAVEPERILDTGLFDPARARSHPLWFKELHGAAGHVPETEEYGLSSFCFRARKPFDPDRIRHVLLGHAPCLLNGVLRGKGHLWTSDRPEIALDFSLAGRLSSIAPAGRWWAAVPQAQWPGDKRVVARIFDRWRPPYGDRRQELVFIGTREMNRESIVAALEACLVDGAPARLPRLPASGIGAGPVPPRPGAWTASRTGPL